MKPFSRIPFAVLLLIGAVQFTFAADGHRNVILFVPDGLRSEMVTPANAPTMAALRDQGVAFTNSHSVFPTFTTANASVFATGHYLGDTGDFSNTIHAARPIAAAHGSVTPFLENDAVLGEMDEHFGGDYLHQETVMRAASRAGFNTAAVGKLGPTLIFDHTDRSGARSVIADDSTGSAGGIPLPQWARERLAAEGMALAAPSRGANGNSGSSTLPGTTRANLEQQQWFVDLFTKVVLKKFKEDDKPFFAVFWSRDPDGSQHNEGDSLNTIVPGINGPTALAGIRNADDNLRAIVTSLKALGLDANTDIIVSADHGFSTVSKQSKTSHAAGGTYEDVPAGFLPPGFLAIDLAHALGKKLADPDQDNRVLDAASHPKYASGLIGDDPRAPEIVVAGNGGSDLIYLPNRTTKAQSRMLVQRMIDVLVKQDYVSGLFVDSSLGKFKGALAMKDVNLEGSASTPRPAIVVNFRSFSSGCALPTTCSVEVSDSTLQQGQGMHGSFSRGDTFNFTAAAGPSFKRGFVDTAPVSNVDVSRTIASLLGVAVPDVGVLHGRVLHETMPGGAMPRVQQKTIASARHPNGLQTILRYQQVGSTWYFDTAGFPGRTLGLDTTSSAADSVAK